MPHIIHKTIASATDADMVANYAIICDVPFIVANISLSAIRYPIESPIIVMIWNIVFTNKSRKLGWIWMKLGGGVEA